MSDPRGKQVRLFLVDGTAGGLVTAEVMNWTGHVTAGPRTELPELMRMDEVKRTGVYILLGDDPTNPVRQAAYVGESDDVAQRLYLHARDTHKDFWDRVVVLTSKDANLTKAHARYLEGRLIELATRAGRYTLHNGTAPSIVGLPRPDVSDMEYFVEQARILLPVLGVNLLRVAEVAPVDPRGPSPGPDDRSPLLELTIPRRGVSALAQEIDGEFTVKAGAQATPRWTGAALSYSKLREQLEQDGTLTEDGNHMTLVKDQVFSSPSAASAVLLGRNSNGRAEWKVSGTGQSYGQWQDSLLPGEAD